MRIRPYAAFLSLLPLLASGQALKFSVTWDASQLKEPFSGRIVVCLGHGGEPRLGPNWFKPSPMYSTIVKNMKAGTPVVIDNDDAIGFPGKLADLTPGEYTVQVVIDRNLGGRSIGSTPGNLYSEATTLALDPAKSGTVSLVASKVIPEEAFKDTKQVHEVVLESKLLSRFYRRPTKMRAAVVLPDAWYSESVRKFPIIFEIPGFGGNHYSLSGSTGTARTLRGTTPFIRVVLNPDCPTGHCVFADSANNGPWGKALTTELVPYIEKAYRAIGKPGARFVTGHSSGGWSSLWLQVAYPDFFGGVWSTSPDPVDFRDFQRINLYDPKSNMFTDEKGGQRPLARRGEIPFIFYKAFSDMERPLGRGEQLGSFEGVFSGKGRDGEPKKLWNRDTGAIDAAVAETWKKYDISLTLRNNWATLGPKLKGKLHVYMGDIDTFYLDGAVRLLKKDMDTLGSDAVIEIVPGDHGSMMTPALRKRIDAEMAAQFTAFEKSGTGL